MLSATNGVAGSGKKPRKSRGKGLRTNTGWYVVNIYTAQPFIQHYTPLRNPPALVISSMRVSGSCLGVARDGGILT